MPTTKVSKTSPSFDIKSALLPLESVIIRSDDIDLVGKDLDTRFSKHPDFFDNDPVMIDLTQIQDSTATAPLDLAKLCQILKKYRMNPVAIRSNNPTHHAWAELAGLFLITASQMPSENKRAPTADKPSPAPAPKTAPPPASEPAQLSTTSQSTSGPEGTSAGTQAAIKNPSPGQSEKTTSYFEEEASPLPSCALIIDKPLRSGQHVYAKGRDLVVMAMVNAGAEIMADGHIHVYAPLRGKAIAGAKGNKEARIYTSCLEAELVSIAGVYRTSDTPIPKEVAGKSAQIRLIDDKLVMQPQ